MRARASFRDKASVTVDRHRGLGAALTIGGYFTVQCIGPDGEEKWCEDAPNIWTNESLNDVLDVYIKADAAAADNFFGLINNTTPTLAAGDTLASHTWNEDTTWTGTPTRKTAVFSAASSQSIDNAASVAAFAMTGTVVLFGAFLATVATGSSGVIICEGGFASTQAVDSGDTVNVTYTVTAADS